jgi:cytidylate kinase
MNLRNLSLSASEALIRSNTPSERSGATPVRFRPNIAISREVGALGNTVATAVAARLGLSAYDKLILEKVSEEMRLPASKLQHLDERGSNWIEEAIASLLLSKPVNPGSYIKYLVGAIRGLGEIGGGVFVGRGSNFILPPGTTLRVRLIGDLEDRVKVIMKRNGLDEKEARTWITRTERERTEFIRQTFDIEVTDPHHYDMILNSSRLSAEECVELIVTQFTRLEARTKAARAVA